MSQYASGYLYGGNNPTLGTDPSGNFFFASLAYLIPAAIGAGQGLAIANQRDLDPLGKFGFFLAGGVVGGLSGAAATPISSTTSGILGMAVGSSISSVGFSALSGGAMSPSVNFAFGTYDFGSGKVNWTNPFKNENWMEVLGDATSLAAIGKDAFRVQLAIRGKNDPAVQEFNQYPRGEHGQGGYPYDDIGGTGDIGGQRIYDGLRRGDGKITGLIPDAVASSGDVNEMNVARFRYRGWTGPTKIEHLRRNFLHYKFEIVETSRWGDVVVAAEVYQNYWPVQSLGGVGVVFHGVFEGQTVFGAFEPAAIPAVVFTDPEIAWCGLTETEAKERGRDIKVARFPWAASGRATTLGRSDGVTKLIVDPQTERVLGVGIAGPGAGELIAEGVLAVEMAALASDIALSIHPHPTLSETLMESADLSYGQSIRYYRPRKR